MNPITEKYGGRVRVRASGIFIINDSILLIKHRNLGSKGELWAPPGGEVDFGESVNDALEREVHEETGLYVKKATFQFINEYIAPPLHAIEFFFNVTAYNGAIKKGQDPEMGHNQIIEEVKFVSFHDLHIMEDDIKHNILKGKFSEETLKSFKGTIRN